MKPSNFETNIINIYGTRGKEWLNSLPEQIISIAAANRLSALTPVNNLSYNYVLSGFQGSQPIILKLSLDIAGLQREASALKAFVGFGAINVLAEDNGLLLLERAIPGTALKSYFPSTDADALRITCDVIKRLHQAPLPKMGFPHIKDWLSALDKEWNIPDHFLNKARAMRDTLLASSYQPVLLHGDLHHDNILSSQNNWVIIDPKGVIGDPAFEVGAFIRNPLPEILEQNDLKIIITTRIQSFAEILNIPEKKILNWCYVEAVLSWIWDIEDNCNKGYFKRFTEIFDHIAKEY